MEIQSRLTKSQFDNQWYFPVDCIPKLIEKENNIHQELELAQVPNITDELKDFIRQRASKTFLILVFESRTRDIVNFHKYDFADAHLPIEPLYESEHVTEEMQGLGEEAADFGGDSTNSDEEMVDDNEEFADEEGGLASDDEEMLDGYEERYVVKSLAGGQDTDKSFHEALAVFSQGEWQSQPGHIFDFCRDQWMFLAPIFEEGQNRYDFHPSTIFPFEVKDGEQKGGGFSKISKIQIHPAHMQQKVCGLDKYLIPNFSS